MGSAAGEIFGSLVFVASLLGPDGSRDWVEKVFLPEKIDGQSIETEEEARNWLFKVVESKVHKAAEINGWLADVYKIVASIMLPTNSL